jgi:hypothetical protein
VRGGSRKSTYVNTAASLRLCALPTWWAELKLLDQKGVAAITLPEHIRPRDFPGWFLQSLLPPTIVLYPIHDDQGGYTIV